MQKRKNEICKARVYVGVCACVCVCVCVGSLYMPLAVMSEYVIALPSPGHRWVKWILTIMLLIKNPHESLNTASTFWNKCFFVLFLRSTYQMLPFLQSHPSFRMYIDIHERCYAHLINSIRICNIISHSSIEELKNIWATMVGYGGILNWKRVFALCLFRSFIDGMVKMNLRLYFQCMAKLLQCIQRIRICIQIYAAFKCIDGFMQKMGSYA